ncbi:ABC transporter ATP-binding protein [Clostridium estertheticum]|uniref:ABC transporter ATP-binding protein n=1 Tax=Clostridium estertheticum TaxID=238834 RepID=UPI001CF33B63|nr:ABC transporter ATP-binding protein [Clostridium estertheticum]MCB2359140.1 ABC transporter ATP-binding protein [Clostridium estertheticum]
MKVLSIQNLNKSYEKFALKNVSFSMQQGTIMGFIGRNGAGKTTTLKALLNYVHADSGIIKIFGEDFSDNEFLIKQKIGFVSGGVNYYPKKKLKIITEVTKRFYERWDEAAYKSYLERFKLDPDKKTDELSEGMKVKYQLALALSHHAKLLIFDEPTSGLDPVSRDDMLDLFITLVEEEQVSILFSTHITSDLEKCAKYVTYIKNGEILASTDKKSFLNSYRIVKGSSEQLTEEISKKLISFKRHMDGFCGLVRTENLPIDGEVEILPADLESIMIYIEKE